MGKSHNDTIIARHNLAELLLSSGEPDNAASIQEDIIQVVSEKERMNAEKATAAAAAVKVDAAKAVVHETSVSNVNNVNVVVNHTRKKK